MEAKLVFPYLDSCNYKQAAFHASDAPNKAFVGGYGCGKTTSLIHEVWMRLQECQNTTALIGRKTYRELIDTTWKMSLQLIPQPLIRKVSREDMQIVLPNNCDIIFRSMEDELKLSSLNLGIAALDEAHEIDVKFYDALQKRLRGMHGLDGKDIDGMFLMASNYAGHNWIWQKFKMAEDKKRFFLVESGTMENKKNLPVDYLERLKDLPPEIYKRNVDGTFDDFEGQVFTTYDERVHVHPFDLQPGWRFMRAIDPGLNHPTVCLWYAVDQEGNIFVYDEYVQQNVSVEANAYAMIFKGTQHQVIYEHPQKGHVEEVPVIRGTVIDPASMQRSQHTMKTTLAEYADSGIKPIRTAPREARNVGMPRISEYLSLRKDWYHPFLKIKPAPKLYIHPRCLKLRSEIISFTWEQFHKKIKDDCIDALKYILVSEAHPAVSQHRGVQPEYKPSNSTTGY